MENAQYDVAIVGGGVIGCAVARELSRYELKICLLERAETSVPAHPKPTAPSSTPVLTRRPVP